MKLWELWELRIIKHAGGGGGGFDQNKTIRIQELFYTYKIMKIYMKKMIKYCRQAQEKKIA